LITTLPIWARRRAGTRRVWLTDEFAFLHRRDRADPPAADARIETTGLGIA
jgi:hypothetical protein